MFSVLNDSNESSKPEELSIKDIEMLVDREEQNWIRRAHVGLEDIRTSLNGLKKCEMFTSSYQTGVPRRFGLGLNINKTRGINSFQPLGSCMSL